MTAREVAGRKAREPHGDHALVQQRHEPATFQVKDKNGNIVFQDVVIPDKLEIYQIDLDGFKADQYELLYIEKAVTFIGEFEIE